jgi:hypothetical protein
VEKSLNKVQKFPRIVRLDDSDGRIYEPAAAAGEWAVIGTFYFWDADLENLSGQTRQAFVHGFLGTQSFGWGTLVSVAEITPDELDAITLRLALHLVNRFGAPSIEAALPAAQEEIAFAAGLCGHAVNTLLAIQRDFIGEQITESFRIIRPPTAAAHEQLHLWGVDRDPTD